jgi:hypothetical protein
MPKAFHDRIYRGVKKAHPKYSEARAERETNAVMANIAKGSKRKGTFPGRGRHKPAPAKAGRRVHRRTR